MEPVVLTRDQTRFLELFARHAEFPKYYYLSGGTALAAYYLHHRESDDLDFFTDLAVALPAVTAFIQQAKDYLDAKKLTYEHLYDRHIFTLETKPMLKVEFTRYPFSHLAPFIEKNGIRVDSLLDIGVNKLFALFDRNEPKDFVDLYFILKKFPLKKLVAGVKKKFDFTISPLTLGSELLKVRHVELFPRMRKPVTKHELVAFFEAQAYKLKNDIIA